MAEQPLVDWLSVNLSESRPASAIWTEEGFFTVDNTGKWTEVHILTSFGFTPPPSLTSGQLDPFEFKVLDLLVDRINQETIPTPPTLVTPVTPPDKLALFLRNPSAGEAVQYSLFRSFDEATGSNPGSYFAYDDVADIVEIAALGAVMGHLEHKYGNNYDFFV
jgi:hypothetical protein